METNMEDEKVEPVVTELGLDLGYSGYRIGRRSSSNDLGAGANAASRIGLTYVAAEPLSEIVWSPQKGLCLKCIQCSFSKNKRSLVWGAGAVCSPQEMTSARSINEQNIYASSSTFPDLNTKVSDIDSSDKSARDNDDIRSCHEPQADNDNSFQGSAAFVNFDEKNDPRGSENNQVADIAKPIENNVPTSPDGQKQDVALIESLFNDPGNEVGDVGDQTQSSRMQMVSVSIVHTDNECDAFGTTDKNMKSPAENDLQGQSKDECVATSKLSGSESASKAEKNSQHRMGIALETMSACKHSPTSSHESVESCTSAAAMFSADKKRQGFEHQLIVGSKRVKRQIHDENPCSSSIVIRDSSFMNWISNMMKGFMESKDQIPSLALTTAVNINLSHESPDEDLDAGDNTKSIDAENTNSSNLPVDVEKDRSSTSTSLGKRKMNTKSIDSDPHSKAKMARNISHKSNPLGSLWITRFTPKGSSSLLSRNTSGTVECSSDCMKLTPFSENDVNVSNNLETMEAKLQCPQEPLTASGKEMIDASIGLNSLRSKDSEPLASLLARRLDALKHMMPSGVPDNRVSSTVTCFFCGRKGHHLQYCPEITDNEIGQDLRNMKSSNGFELNHWAVSCPTASVGCGGSSLELLDENQESIAGWTARIDTGKCSSTPYEVIADKMKSNANVISSSKEIKPWGNFINSQVSDTPKAIFDAVRMLRLSRTDILNWKNSQTSVSHLKGFFLRLRLAKWEKGLGGTGYYVAYITGTTLNHSRKSIAVNVGGIECLVESQYISNHDFLEEELTAWLLATKKNGGKIPSQEELTVKVKERRMLVF